MIFFLAALSSMLETILKNSFAFSECFSVKAVSNFLIAVLICDLTALLVVRLFRFFRASFSADVCLSVFSFMYYPSFCTEYDDSHIRADNSDKSHSFLSP